MNNSLIILVWVWIINKRGLLAIVLSHDIPNQFFPDSRLVSVVSSSALYAGTTRYGINAIFINRDSIGISQ